jgi:hypothetical protein
MILRCLLTYYGILLSSSHKSGNEFVSYYGMSLTVLGYHWDTVIGYHFWFADVLEP